MIVNNFTNINKTNNHLSPQIIEYKKITKSDVRNPGSVLVHAQTCDGVKPNPLFVKLISNENTDINNQYKTLHKFISTQTDHLLSTIINDNINMDSTIVWSMNARSKLTTS